MRLSMFILASFIIVSSVHAQQCITTKPPKDAIILLKGDDTSQWKAQDGGKCLWKANDGVITASHHNIVTKREFGDVQLHIEFWLPKRPADLPAGHGNGNSGVYLHGDYEIQVIDSYKEGRSAKGSCGAIYGQHAAMTRATLPAEQWQSYDIFFRAPIYGKDGKPIKKARMTVIHNGIFIHHDVECDPTPGGLREHFKHSGPLFLQMHGHPVKYRNIWIRDLEAVKKEDEREHSGK